MGTKQSLKGKQKQCANCKRVLSGRAYVYNQFSSDKLRDVCRTCDSYKPKGYPSLAAVEEHEAVMQQIIKDAVDLVEGDVSRRVAIEQFVYSEMDRLGLLELWKPPVWLHKSSLRQS